MALGVPVVTTDVAGTKELVVDGETGYVLPQADARGIAHALIGLTENADVRARMSHAGRARIEREFSFFNRLRRIETLYETLLAAKHFPSSGIEAHSQIEI
jgi:glycosyltransferase involved in cell wall biosynthesis